MMAGGVEGIVSRFLRVGFEVRLTVLTIDGQDVSVILTRTHARALGLEEGRPSGSPPPPAPSPRCRPSADPTAQPNPGAKRQGLWGRHRGSES